MNSRMDDMTGDNPERMRADVALRECAAYRWNLRMKRYEYVSPVIAEVTGFSAEEVYAMSPEDWLARIHPEDRLNSSFDIARITSGGRSVMEYRFQHKNGQYRWMADRADVSPETEESPRCVVGFWRKLEHKGVWAIPE